MWVVNVWNLLGVSEICRDVSIKFTLVDFYSIVCGMIFDEQYGTSPVFVSGQIPPKKKVDQIPL